MLSIISPEQLEHLAAADGFLAHMERVYVQFADYMSSGTWFSSAHPDVGEAKIAYFSLEFGLSENMPIYSGDLGDAEMFRVVEVVNGFLKRVNAEDFSRMLASEPELPGPSDTPHP